MPIAVLAQLLLGGAAVAESRTAPAELGRPLVVVGDPESGMHTRMPQLFD